MHYRLDDGLIQSETKYREDKFGGRNGKGNVMKPVCRRRVTLEAQIDLAWKDNGLNPFFSGELYPAVFTVDGCEFY